MKILSLIFGILFQWIGIMIMFTVLLYEANPALLDHPLAPFILSVAASSLTCFFFMNNLAA